MGRRHLAIWNLDPCHYLFHFSKFLVHSTEVYLGMGASNFCLMRPSTVSCGTSPSSISFLSSVRTCENRQKFVKFLDTFSDVFPPGFPWWGMPPPCPALFFPFPFGMRRRTGWRRARSSKSPAWCRSNFRQEHPLLPQGRECNWPGDTCRRKQGNIKGG